MAAEVKVLRSGWAEQRITSSDDESAPAHNEADADAGDHAQRSSRQLMLSCVSLRSTKLPPTGRYFSVIGWPERLLLMRSTSAALRLAPTPPGVPVAMTSPWWQGNSRPRTEALTQPFRLRAGTTALRRFVQKAGKPQAF